MGDLDDLNAGRVERSGDGHDVVQGELVGHRVTASRRVESVNRTAGLAAAIAAAALSPLTVPGTGTESWIALIG